MRFHAEVDQLSEILIGRGILKEPSFKEALLKIAERFAVIMDETVCALFRSELSLLNLNCEIFTFPAGEEFKTRETKQRLEDEMLAAGFGRGSAVIAIGGGVTCDLAGFLASTYYRGVPAIYIPTTLLCMVDASIGGKTGVNTPFGKNLIGAFCSPKLVVMDLDLLSSLPEHQIRSGMAEVIKYALTLDSSLLDENNLEMRIFRSCKLKKEVIESDFREGGRRRILNFGHTIGHAIELIENYKITHGDAVAIGMLFESIMSHEMGYLNEKSLSAIAKILFAHNFPLELTHAITREKLMQAMRHDKKSSPTAVRFVALEEIGRVLPFGGTYCIEVKDEIVEKALKRYAALIHHTYCAR